MDWQTRISGIMCGGIGGGAVLALGLFILATFVTDDIQVNADRIERLQSDVADIRVDNTEIRGNIEVLQNDVSIIKGDIVGIKGDIVSINEKIDGIESKLDQLLLRPS